MNNHEHCHVGSCQRHQDCMYTPCRASVPPMTNQIKSGGEREPWARPNCKTCGGWGYVYAVPRDGGEPYRCSCGNCHAQRDKSDIDADSRSGCIASTSQGADGRHAPNLSRTPAKAGEDGVREAGQRVLHDKVHAEARAIHLKDMTQSGYDFWLIRVAAEHGARIALSSIEEPRGE